ncbi:2-dehydropantoate 2-reductase [Thermaurantiacus sp.]
MADRAKIAVFGAGLIGAHVGGRLAAVADVTLIGRPWLVDAARHGLRVSDLEGFDRRLGAEDIRITTEPDALAKADLVLVSVKSLATADAARAIARLAPPAAPVVSLQNGVSNPDILRAHLPGRVVLAGMVPFNVSQPEEGQFHRGTGVGKIVVEAHDALQPFLPLFAAAGVPIDPSPNILGVQWGKLLINLNNAVNALSGVSLMEELRQRDYRRAWAMCLKEGLALVKAAGITPVDPLPMPLDLMPAIMSLPDRLYGFVVSQAGGGRSRVDPLARSSMADDLAKGRPTEVDQLNGEIVRLAARLSRTAPVNARMLELVRKAEAGAPPIPAKLLVKELRDARQA